MGISTLHESAPPPWERWPPVVEPPADLRPQYTQKQGSPLNFSGLPGGEDEIRTRGRDCSLRRFSKPVVSATHPPLHGRACLIAGTNVGVLFERCKQTVKNLFGDHCLHLF